MPRRSPHGVGRGRRSNRSQMISRSPRRHRRADPQGRDARRRLLACASKASRRGTESLVPDIWTALGERTVVVPGTAAADTVLRALAKSWPTTPPSAELARQVETALDAHPLGSVLTHMPGVGVRTGARILLDVGGASSFPPSGT